MRRLINEFGHITHAAETSHMGDICHSYVTQCFSSCPHFWRKGSYTSHETPLVGENVDNPTYTISYYSSGFWTPQALQLIPVLTVTVIMHFVSRSNTFFIYNNQWKLAVADGVHVHTHFNTFECFYYLNMCWERDSKACMYFSKPECPERRALTIMLSFYRLAYIPKSTELISATPDCLLVSLCLLWCITV